ncbi:MAG TPA: Lrp/AsnC family transcriptional regulator [Alphaproteobacteria bacterium]|nr:Lrp/AsnC family transcriptional regulator [Alphaproteobacteria bacterium]
MSRDSLDATDRKILNLLQEDCRIANQELAARVGLSPPACLKRVQRLRERGVIRREVALLDRLAVGQQVLVLVRLALERPREDLLRAFERKVQEIPEVLSCWCVAGDHDFVLLVCARTLDEYQSFARTVLAGELNLRRYSSDVVLSIAKETTAIPLAAAPIS